MYARCLKKQIVCKIVPTGLNKDVKLSKMSPIPGSSSSAVASDKQKLGKLSFLTWLEPFVAWATGTNNPRSIFGSSLGAMKNTSRSYDNF